MSTEKSIVYTNENCIGCNKCIKVCSAIGACVSREEEGRARIVVDGNKCVACGSCIDVCVHGAREFLDDTERFIKDLLNGEEISLLLAPAFKANYPDEYESVLGGLKQLGVKRIISVSFGADITTWGYLNYIKDHAFTGGISQPCPAVVSYIERYLPDLIPKLFPVQSPLMCAAIYARKEFGITDKFAFISPCIAKKLEIEDPHNAGLVQYNVTFEHLIKYVRDHNIKGPLSHSEVEYGLGSFYPAPGGLSENVRWFLGDQVFIRQVEGERHLYEWLHRNEELIKKDETGFLFIDALNCKNGCICGTAVNTERSKTDDALRSLLKIREKSKRSWKGSAWSRPDTPIERFENYNRQFEYLDLNDYLREYSDRSHECFYDTPDPESLDRIFNDMNKHTEDSRHIDCTCCGYESCTQMATAIFNGFNHKENCIYYEKTKISKLEVEKTIAEEATRAKSAFLANMSHEIRTPINAVLGMNEMILRESSEDKIIEYAENVRTAGNTLLGLINNVLDFSKIEAGKLEIIPVEYDLTSVVNDLVNMVQTKADSKGLTLKLDINEDTPKLLFGDELRIKQIITNLLTNAVKYTEEGSVIFKLDFERDDNDPESLFLDILVKDTGIGIKPEDLSKLFSEFERIEQERNRTIEGTGLGMSITRQLLKMMGSKLSVESVYGEGSVFSFRLKQKVIKWDTMGDFERSYQEALSGRKKYRRKFTAPDAKILVVDDTDMNLTVFENLLKSTGVQIDTALSGKECLLLSINKKYDLIFLDHMMPEMDGIETLHKLRSDKDDPNLETPVICLTANAISGAREQYLSEGFNDYLTKPIDADTLEEMLIEYLPEEKLLKTELVEEEASEETELKGDKWYESIPGLDAAAALKNSGSEESFLSAAKIYYDTYDAKKREIEDYYNKEDWTNYTIKVHALKSSSRIVGASELGSKAEALELAGNNRDIDFIRSNHEDLMRSYGEIRGALAVGFESSEDLPDVPEDMLMDAYGGLNEFAGAMDYELTKMVIDSMKEFKLPPEDAERFKRLSDSLSNLDWDGISEILKEKPL